MPYSKRKAAEPQSILKNRGNATPDKLSPEHAEAIAGLVAAALRNQNAIYLQPGRYGSVTAKFYIEGDAFAETLQLNDELPDLCEQVVAELYTQDDVGWNRKVFAPGAAERAAAARKGTKAGES